MDNIIQETAVLSRVAATTEPSRLNMTLVIFGAALGLACGFGPMFFSVIGIFLKPMAASFGWGRADVALLPTLGMIGTAISAPIGGYIADKVGWRKVIAYSIFLFAAALLALSMAPPNRIYLAAVGLAIGIAGAATTAAGYLAVMPQMFDRRLGMAFGLGMLGTGIGGIVAPLMANKLANIMDWRQTFILFAAVSLLLGVIAHQLIFRNLHSGTQVSMGETMHKLPVNSYDGITFREALKTYRFWLIAIIVALISCTILGGFIHLASFASDRGMPASIAAQAMAVVGLGLVVARVAVGAILDRVFAPAVSLVAFGVGAIGFFILTTNAAHSPVVLLAAALMLGISTGAEGDIIPYLTRKYFGKRAYGAIYGTLFGFATFGGAMGPFIYGLAFDRLKSYTPIHEVSGVICAVCAVGILLLGRYPIHPASGRRNVSSGVI